MKIEHFIKENKSFIFLQKGDDGLVCTDFSSLACRDFLGQPVAPSHKTPWTSGNLIVSPYFYDHEDFDVERMQGFKINHWEKCTPSTSENDKDIHLEFCGSLADYQESIQACIEAIKDGDFYQANLLRFFTLKSKKDLRYHLLSLLQSHKPAMALWIQTKNFSLFSLSPESFIKVKHQPSGESVIQSYPIKGTLKIDHHHLNFVKKRLAEDTKEVSELNMIIDLVRDDLHKVCKIGSVQVPSSGKFLSIGNLMHRYAEVSGTLQKNMTYLKLLQSTLPAASVTGCPKSSANLFIKKHEKKPRGFFMGNAFYFDDSGGMDSSVLIRTLHKTDNQWHGAAGSGIVIPSIPEKEAQETEAKAKIFTSAPKLKR